MSQAVSHEFRNIILFYKFRLYLVSKSGNLIPKTSRQSLIVSYTILGNLWTYSLIQWLLLINVFLKRTSIDQRVLGLLWAAGYSLLLVFVTHTFNKRTRIANFVNHFIGLDKTLQKRYKSEERIEEIVDEKHYLYISRIIRLVPWSSGSMLGLMYLQSPYSFRYIYSQIYIYVDHPILKLLWFLYETITGVCMWQCVIFTFIIIGVYIYNTSCWLDHLNSIDLINKGLTLHSYRALQLLNNEFNSCYAKLIIPTMIGTIIASTLCSTIVIRFHDSINLFTFIFLTSYSAISYCVVVYAYKFAGAVCHNSILLIRKKFVSKSLPLKIWIMNFSYFKRTATVITLFFMTKISVRILIAMK